MTRMNPTTSAPVIQSDREAAADMWKAIGRVSFADWQPDWMRDGTSDSGPVVQAFAAYRARLVLGGWEVRGALQDCVEMLQRFVHSMAMDDKHVKGRDALQRAARALAHPDRLAAGASVREALEWYAEQVAGCRKIGSLGAPYQHSLDADGGKRARQALAALSAPSQVGERTKAVGWLREWSNGRPSEGLVKRQNLSERDIEMMCVALAAAADTIEQRLSAAPVQAGEEGK